MLFYIRKKEFCCAQPASVIAVSVTPFVFSGLFTHVKYAALTSYALSHLPHSRRLRLLVFLLSHLAQSDVVGDAQIQNLYSQAMEHAGHALADARWDGGRAGTRRMGHPHL